MNVTAKSEFYEIPREFNDTRLSTPAYSFGISRKFYEKVFIEKSYIPEKENPGPGTYNYTKDFGSDGLKFTKYLKGISKSKIRINKGKNLGPGEYIITKIDINEEGKYVLSSLKNSPSLSFGKAFQKSKSMKTK